MPIVYTDDVTEYELLLSLPVLSAAACRAILIVYVFTSPFCAVQLILNTLLPVFRLTFPVPDTLDVEATGDAAIVTELTPEPTTTE